MLVIVFLAILLFSQRANIDGPEPEIQQPIAPEDNAAFLISKYAGINLPLGTLDVTFYRDDFRTNLGSPKIGASNILFEIEEKTVILIDDVLYTGRTIRAAMDEIFTYGRPSSIQLGVLVDRGHRELPIRADYVCKNYPTSIDEHIHVHLEDVDDEDAVLLIEYDDTQ